MILENNSIFNNALESLKNKGFLFDKIQKINGGINSNCWQLYDKNQNYFLKFYKSDKNDKRDRFSTELNFLAILKEENFSEVPRVLLSDQLRQWALFSWIDGEKIKEANFAQWKIYLDFIIDLQRVRFSKNIEQINNASEACFTIENHYCLIENRLNSLLSCFSENKKNVLYIWLKDKILFRLNLLKSDINRKSSFTKLINYEKIISPSDVGFHNVLYNLNKLYFFDFEYAGWDDAYKLFVDLIIRPDNIVEEVKAIEIINYLSNGLKIHFEKSFFKFYLELFRIKWILIILNKIYKNQIRSQKEFSKILTNVISYDKEVGRIWKLEK